MSWNCVSGQPPHYSPRPQRPSMRRRSASFRGILTACFLAVYASHPSVARREATLATGLPATALTRPDLHRRDFFERFHYLIQFLLSRAFPSAIGRALISASRLL